MSSRVALVLASASIVASGGTLAPMVVAVSALSMAYRARLRSRRSELRIVFAHVILVKIPALSIALACDGTPALSSFARAMALYGLVGAYELAHDEDARRSPLAPHLAVLDAACLLVGPVIWLISRAWRIS